MIIHICKSNLLKTRPQTGFKILQKPLVGLRTPDRTIHVSYLSILEGIPKMTLLTITKVQLEIPQLQNTTHRKYSVRKEEFFQ